MNGKKIFSRILVAVTTGVLLMCPVLAASLFPDVDENAVYAEAVEYVNEIGIMQGDTQGNFNPEKNVTRAQMAVIVCRMFGETENLTVSNRFSDVKADYWANTSISKAAELGIIGGYGDGTFRPDNTVTYEQAVAMVIRAVGGEEVAKEYGGYPDGYLLAAEENGFLDQISANRGGPFSRSNVAVILYNYYMMSSVADGQVQ